nr:phosphatase PAP2 family protein [uncultured Carboxylicivirga sp.]
MYKFTFAIAILLLSISTVYAQSIHTNTDTTKINHPLKFKYQSLIIPVALISYGVIGNDNGALEGVNNHVKEEVKEHIDEKFTIDDISQHLPYLSVYALNLAGIKGKHTFRDRTVILATSYLFMATMVTTLKYTTQIERPDGSSKNSFPSGHTATAFMGAEFLWQEYKEVSPWYGLTGYAVAAGTGAFRMANNRHWLTDVAAGAGIGMLSTKMAYWINPWMTKIMFGKNKNQHNTSVLMPYYNGHQTGLVLSARF